MKPPRFDYVRADDPEAAIELLAEHGEDARILAGGQSLMAVLNMRLAQPQLLIDISRSSVLGISAIEKNFLAMLRQKEIQSSMAADCFGNAFAESFNDILKNHLFHGMHFNSISQLVKLKPFFSNAYNFNRPHGALHGMTPVEFENHILNLQPCQRPLLEIKPVKRPD